MKKTPLQQNEVRAVSKYIRMSPTKVRRVLRQIQGKNYSEALLLLEFMPYVSCDPIIKVLRSAAANAKNNSGFALCSGRGNVFCAGVLSYVQGPSLMCRGKVLCAGAKSHV